MTRSVVAVGGPRLAALLYVGALAAGGCSAAGERHAVAAAGQAGLLNGAGDVVREGWIVFHEEFQLYDTYDAMVRGDQDHCISGALPLTKQRAAEKKYRNKQARVRVRGTLVEWKLPKTPQFPVTGLALMHDGSPILNGCLGRFVLFATSIGG